MEDIAMDAAIVTAIIGGIVTSIGLFLFLHGMKQQQRSGTPKHVT